MNSHSGFKKIKKKNKRTTLPPENTRNVKREKGYMKFMNN